MNKEIEIPEGYEARIEGNKVIIKQKESEDERIRKELLIDIPKVFPHDKAFKYIAWLEKQKDASKAIEAVDRIDKYIDEQVANAHDMKDSNPDKEYYRGWDDALGKIAGILQHVYSEEKQKGPQPAECIPDSVKFEEGFKTGRELGFREGVESVKPAEWSEEDEHLIDEAAEMLRRYAECVQGGNSKIYVGCLADRIESLRPQPKQEWSEKDKEMKNNTILSLQYLLDESINTGFIKGVEKEIKWLKSIRPQPHWKPSKEQMEILRKTFQSCYKTGEHNIAGYVLESLYNDLKKL